MKNKNEHRGHTYEDQMLSEDCDYEYLTAMESLTPAQLETEARLLYEECQTVKPTWEQLGDVTKSVWRDRVLAGARAVLW